MEKKLADFAELSYIWLTDRSASLLPYLIHRRWYAQIKKCAVQSSRHKGVLRTIQKLFSYFSNKTYVVTPH